MYLFFKYFFYFLEILSIIYIVFKVLFKLTINFHFEIIKCIILLSTYIAVYVSRNYLEFN